jgi:hypothetical protein
MIAMMKPSAQRLGRVVWIGSLLGFHAQGDNNPPPR